MAARDPARGSVPAATERLGGSVERVVFHAEESGFCVLRVAVRGRREPVTVVGRAAAVAPGEHVECQGQWVNDRTHGLQFRAAELRTVAPSTREGIERYLASGMVRGIGPRFAKRLVAAFGERIFEVIERQPERLLELEGIGPKRKARLVEAWAEQRAVREIMVFLQSHGVGTARAVRIFKTYGDAALERVRENPYRLALDIHGIGFKSADQIARRLGIAPDSLIRARAGLRHVLQEIAAEGHCAAERSALLRRAAALLEAPEPTIERALEEELAAGELVAEPIEGRACVLLAALQRAEVGVAGNLGRLLEGPPAWGPIDTARAIPWVERQAGITLSAGQREAVARAVNGKVTVITGGPGVGKTTVVNAILRILAAKGVRMDLCAPTGRAARRLADTTGREARTIHRLLEFDPRRFAFKHDRERPLETDLVVVDECSMIDVVLMSQLLRAIPSEAALLLVGDVDQLPSVGPGAVLADLIASRRVPTVRLEEVFRQAAASRIIVNAHRIHRGELPERPAPGRGLSDFYLVACAGPEEIHERLMETVTERIPRRFGLDPVAEVQVLTPMNRGPLGARALNVELQARLNPAAEPALERFGWRYAPGDKAIQMVNDYEKEVFNGDIGRVAGVDPEEGVVRIDFDGRAVEYRLDELDELSLAYATTVHKSQGSEYPAVVIPLAVQHYTLLARNLLYTAVTRGRRLVVLIAEPRALAIAVRNAGASRRLTRLAERLREAGE